MFPGAVWILLVVALVVPAFFVLTWIISSFNRLTALRKAYAQAYAHVDGLLRRRNELILNLVETAKGYIVHEPGATEAVATARNSASAANLRAAQAPGDPAAMRELSGTETALGATLSRLLAEIQTDSELKRDKAMADLMSEMTSINEKLSAARQEYNDSVMRYNVVRATFPNNIIALPFEFSLAESLETRSPNKPEMPTPAA